MSRWCASVEAPPPAVGAPPPVLFLDRDGVLVVEKDYLRDPAAVVLMPGAAAALRRARAAGFRLIGISNQSGLGRGIFTPSQFAAVMHRFAALLREAGCPLDDFYYCPHAPEADCACRKPRTGLLREARERHAWDPARSWVIGDKISDLDLARAAGLRGVLVRTGHGRAQEAKLPPDRGDPVVDDLAAAVDLILAQATR